MMMEKSKVAAVMVLYKKNINEAETFLTLLNKLSIPTLIYDNSPTAQNGMLPDYVSYRHNAQNPGVSQAYNEASIWAENQGCTHILLLDADSSFPQKAFELYLNEVLKSPDALILPAMLSGGHKISPFYFKLGKTYYGDSIKFGRLQLGKMVAINSGTLLPIRLLKEVGGFNEQLPLDWSDIDFMRRLSKRNPQVVHIPLEIQHGLSEHQVESLDAVKFRYQHYLKGIKIVSEDFLERMLMLFWAKLKALKLGFKYRSTWFIFHYIRNFYA